jgi:hypothetical protein
LPSLASWWMWGVCSNAESPFDRTAMFEHDGCDFFEEDPEGWRTPQHDESLLARL